VRAWPVCGRACPRTLPELFALDADRRGRFEREAQLLATLNHPNIAAIYGFEDAGSTSAIVMELVEGPTPADLTARGPLPLPEVLTIASHIALALATVMRSGSSTPPPASTGGSAYHGALRHVLSGRAGSMTAKRSS